MAGKDFKVSPSATINFLTTLLDAKPELLYKPQEQGKCRGIDFYPTSMFLPTLSTALGTFFKAHKRLPDLIDLPTTADYFFKMKFFGEIPVTPNPASKLDAQLYIPQSIKDDIQVPKRFWQSTEPCLPEDKEIPPGTYWLKLDLGNASLRKIEWPPSKDERSELNTIVQGWMESRYGVNWGEWWYGLGSQRIFIEEDLTDYLSTSSEVKIYVRQGKPVFYYTVQYLNKKVRNSKWLVNYFDANHNLIPGFCSYGINGAKSKMAPPVVPENIEHYLDLAAEIGKDFDLLRVDLITAQNDKPFLGELTLCSGNARFVFTPTELEETIKKSLFG